MQKSLSVDLSIDPATVRLFINKAKALAADIGTDLEHQPGESVEFDAERLTDTHHHDGLAEEESDDLTATELEELIDDLNDDEAAALVAIAWVGRGDFDASGYEEAKEQAADRAEGPTSGYLLGMPMLAEYLESGLDALQP
ncbi:MAG: DUF3775 domain-containing protein [Pseudomonadota bacterium]